MHAPTWPSLSSGDVDTACLSTHIITPPDINLILTSRPKKSFSEFFREVQSPFTSIASDSLGHRNQTVLFFACHMLQLDNFWQFRHREIQCGIHAPPPRQPPANIPSCLPPSHPSSAATSHLQPEFSAFTPSEPNDRTEKQLPTASEHSPSTEQVG